ncbi:putative cation-transporting ATPase 13A4 [Rhinophrynus dorsalis]
MKYIQVIEEVESRCLVPGDVIVVPEKKFYIPCDALLISGGCIVDEGMLTGESVPVTKTPLPNVNNSIPWKTHSEDYKRHVLFCGTEVIQTKPSNNGLVKAVVLQIGFNTAKGDLVRSILYPKPYNFKLHRDALRFLMGLSTVAVAAVIYIAVVYTNQGAPTHETVMWSLLIITACIPPALPAASTVGLLYSQKRLQRKGIFCLSAQRINMCGRLNIICFDKTGTLTEDGMALWGVVPSDRKWCFKPKKEKMKRQLQICGLSLLLDIAASAIDGYVLWVLGLVVLLGCLVVPNGAGRRGGTAGVPVEGVTILHQFPFSSSLQRMSVIAQVIGTDELFVFLKGAPEMVIQFSLPETVPENFQKELELYTMQGFRVIALAYKALVTNRHPYVKCLERKEAESDLTFLGLLVMENKIKPETKPVIQELHAANIRTIMITGDNLQTACTIGKASGMVPDDSNLILIEARAPRGGSLASITWQNMTDIYDKSGVHTKTDNFHFAMSGESYEVIVKHFYDVLPKILLNGTIFARMSPGQKSNLIEELQNIDYFAGMCGDGANDCGALKSAYAGISLSKLEASVASPFTSKTPNIECVPKIIKEGRNSIVTAFCMFKYITLYSMISVICLVILFWLLQNATSLLSHRSDNIVWFYACWKVLYDDLLRIMPHIRFIEGLPHTFNDDELFPPSRVNLTIVDDLMEAASESSEIEKAFNNSKSGGGDDETEGDGEAAGVEKSMRASLMETYKKIGERAANGDGHHRSHQKRHCGICCSAAVIPAAE